MIEGLDAIDGVPAGSYGIFLKMHHAASDGMAGMEIMSAIHDTQPVAQVAGPDQPWTPEVNPSTWRLLAGAATNTAAKPVRFARSMLSGARKVPDAARDLPRQLPEMTTLGAPRTRFNAQVTPHRVFDARSFPLGELNRVRACVEGAKVNDVVLAVVGGALRQYLDERGELPAHPLVAACPISVRTDDERSAGGNAISAMMATLATEVADAVARLEAVVASTHRSKAFAAAIGARTLTETAEYLPGGLVGLGARASSRLGIAARAKPLCNTVVSNMPGPRQPLYSCGARLVSMSIIGMISDGMALIHPVSSYCGQMTISFTSCREILPEPEHYADCLQGSFDELTAAAG